MSGTREARPARAVLARVAVWAAFAAPALVLGVASCERSDRRTREVPPTATAMPAVTQVSLVPGAKGPQIDAYSPYENNPYAISEGQRLFEQMNCSGCHFHGGGGIGPPLMDDEWIYGSEPENIFSTIVEGRPNGMPAWRGRLSNQQVWQLVAYIRNVASLVPRNARTGREDHMMVKVQEQSTPPQKPKASFLPKSSEMP